MSELRWAFSTKFFLQIEADTLYFDKISEKKFYPQTERLCSDGTYKSAFYAFGTRKNCSADPENVSMGDKWFLKVNYDSNLSNKSRIIKNSLRNKKNQPFWCLIELIFEKFRKILKFQSARPIETSKLFFDKKFEFYG